MSQCFLICIILRQQHWAYSRVLICQKYIFLGEVSTQFFFLFALCIGLLIFFLLNFESSFYILSMSLFKNQISDLQMCPPGLCLIFSFSVSFMKQKIVISEMSVYQFILLWIMHLVLHLWNLSLASSQKDFLQHSSRICTIFRFKF